MNSKSYYLKLAAKYKMCGSLPEEEYIALMSYAENDPVVMNELSSEGSTVLKLKEIPEEELQKARMNLRRELIRISHSHKPGIGERIADSLRSLLFERRLQVAMGVIMLILGYGIARFTEGPFDLSLLDNSRGLSASVNYVDDPDAQIQNLMINLPEDRKGIIEFEFDAVNHVTMQGKLDNPDIRNLLTFALSENTPAATRLKSIGLMEKSSESETIKKALISALLHDTNPGVRLKALEALSDMKMDEALTASLLDVLETEETPGIRIAAIDILTANPDKKIYESMRMKAMENRDDYLSWKVRELSKNVNLVY